MLRGTWQFSWVGLPWNYFFCASVDINCISEDFMGIVGSQLLIDIAFGVREFFTRRMGQGSYLNAGDNSV